MGTVLLRLQRVRLWWDDAFWLVPLVGVLIAAVVQQQITNLDESLASSTVGVISPGAAQTLFAAVGGGMITFTGFVFSVILLMLQFGSSAYSPRTVSYFMRLRRTQWVLATFLGTVTYAFLSLIEVGSAGRADFVPLFGVVACCFGLFASLLGFLALLHAVGSHLRVDDLLTSIGRISRRQLQRRSSLARSGRALLLDSWPGPATEPGDDVRVVRYVGRTGQLAGVNAPRVLRLARRTGARVVLDLQVGDGVTRGAVIATAHDGKAIGDRQLSRCLLVRKERALRLDGLYALRLLSDIAIRALSPGTNDPTTAVRALDEIEGVLRTAAPLDLGPVEVPAGRGSVVLRGARWADVVDLSLLEIIEYGASSPQVTRRVSALLADLLADLPERRHDALRRQDRRLADAVSRRVPEDLRSDWLTGDRQGLGGSR